MQARLPSTPSARHRRFVLFVLATALLILGWLAMRPFSAPAPAAAAAPTALRVTLTTAEHRAMSHRLTVAGVWIAREDIAISSPLDSLRVTRLAVEAGDRVERGQLLAQLEGDVLGSQARQAEQGVQRARAELADAQARHAEAKAQYERSERLQAKGAVSRQEYEANRAALQSAQATLKSAQAALRQAQAQADEARVRLSHREIRAPAAGLVTQRLVRAGDLVGTQSVLFRLAAEGQLEFEGQVPQQALALVAHGMPAEIRTVGQDDALPGQVRLVGTAIDLASGYGRARIALRGEENGASGPLRAGTAGSARIQLGQPIVWALDTRALRYGNDNAPADSQRADAYVFVADATNRVRRMPVQTGLRDGGWVEIRAGLPPRARVVRSGAPFLREGDVVAPEDGASAVRASGEPEA
ncbi:efflux RND transporter periplasmic adaptor subunit [Cupriavidus sp. CV2]|uniref:efflux RND transporter periplasmic adaptor subunit n=1 Tax=Cupriavidus ulmosensis TaxID=3065913 RepID=UPI00296AF62C|nr:efflux RND transporter periplasmic adaptor subunit [Cupriavidus sp. CV2]MDW3683287.1 efflux RND transporter periplasmic adaptor subunit [Cupriavidus sp. CV2]